MSLSPLAISYFLHLLATIVWLGGMSLLVLVVYPQQKSEPWLQALELRFRPWSNFSLLVLLVTGVVQTSEDEHYGGLLDFGTEWSRAILAKHLAFILMVGIVLFLQFGLAPALERARLLAKKQGESADLQRLFQRERRLTQVNFALGIVVLFFTAIATAY